MIRYCFVYLFRKFAKILEVWILEHLKKLQNISKLLELSTLYKIGQLTHLCTNFVLVSFFEHILGHMKPLLNTKQLKGLISDHAEKKIEIIFKIGRVIAIFPSETKFSR